jgi:hypothetical protein
MVGILAAGKGDINGFSDPTASLAVHGEIIHLRPRKIATGTEVEAEVEVIGVSTVVFASA